MKHCCFAYHMHISHKRMHYSEKKNNVAAIFNQIKIRCFKCMHACKQSACRTQCLQICASSYFSIIVALLTGAVFPILPPPGPSRSDLYYTVSPKSTARCNGITLRDGWIWDKAAVRTGYLANVLSRPCPGTTQEARQCRWKRK